MSAVIPSWFITAIQRGPQKDPPKWYTPPEDDTLLPPQRTPMDSVQYLDPTKTPKIKPGGKPSGIVAHSYWNTPIADRPLKGNSRRWGDASPEVIESVKNKLVEAAQSTGLDKKDTALLLAIAHMESGFNPDAAAGTTSAHGVGQFINKTGSSYKLNDQTRWNVDEQIRALVEHFVDNKKLAQGKDRAYIYAYHHDGPSLKYGGLGLSRDRVMPLEAQYLSSLSGDEGEDTLLALADKKTTE